MDGLYALTGRAIDATEWNGMAVAGGLSYSADNGATWERLVSSREVVPFSSSDEADEDYGVAGYGRYGGCLASDWSPNATYAGGALLQAEEDASLIYIANGDEDHLGVAIWDPTGMEACALPNSGTALPQAAIAWTSSTSASTKAGAGYVRALARMEAHDGTPALLVGYAGRVDAQQSLYICALPDGDLDGIVDGLDCSTGSAVCSEVDTSLVNRAIDVKDIEVRREFAYTNQALVASSGDYTDDSTMTCYDDGEAIFVVEVMGTGGGGVSASVKGEVFTGFADALDTSIESDLTGIAIDSDVDLSGDTVDRYLYAFTPATYDKTYAVDRMYRMDIWGDLDGCDGTSLDPDCDDFANDYDDDGDSFTDEDSSTPNPWVPINGSAADTDGDGYLDDELDREAGLVNASAESTWLTAAQVVVPDRHPARWAPGESIDGVFVPFFAALEDGAAGGRDLAMLASVFNLWGVFDLDMPTASGWDPDFDPAWYIGPVSNWDNTRTFQETVVSDIAQDSLGNVWVPVWDLGLLVQPDIDSDPLTQSHQPMERDCLWDSINAGGASVSIAPTTSGGDAVWVAFFDQAAGSVVPHNMGIWRTLDHGASWGYQAAGIPDADVRDNADPTQYTCKEEPQPCVYCANALGSSGREFSVGGSSLTTAETWGNPYSVSALDENVAVVMFSSYDPAPAADGRLAITLDGGANWTQVTFDGDANDNGITTDANDCSALDFFDRPKGASILRPHTATYSEATYVAGALDAWELEVLVSSRSNDGGNCALARVSLSGTGTTVSSTDWKWYVLDDTGVCQVDGDNILGAVGDPFSDTAYLWGKYEHFRYDRDGSGTISAHDEHSGGACVINLNSPYTLTNLVSPATHRYNIADVAPHPTVADLLAVAPQLDASAWFECMELNPTGSAAVGCPDVPEPLIMERAGATWTESSVHLDLPPSLVGTSIAWGEKETKLYYGTEGAGAWRTNTEW